MLRIWNEYLCAEPDSFSAFSISFSASWKCLGKKNLFKFNFSYIFSYLTSDSTTLSASKWPLWTYYWRPKTATRALLQLFTHTDQAIPYESKCRVLELYKGPALIHMVWPDLYFKLVEDSDWKVCPTLTKLLKVSPLGSFFKNWRGWEKSWCLFKFFQFLLQCPN